MAKDDALALHKVFSILTSHIEALGHQLSCDTEEGAGLLLTDAILQVLPLIGVEMVTVLKELLVFFKRP